MNRDEKTLEGLGCQMLAHRQVQAVKGSQVSSWLARSGVILQAWCCGMRKVGGF